MNLLTPPRIGVVLAAAALTGAGFGALANRDDPPRLPDPVVIEPAEQATPSPSIPTSPSADPTPSETAKPSSKPTTAVVPPEVVQDDVEDDLDGDDDGDDDD